MAKHGVGRPSCVCPPRVRRSSDTPSSRHADAPARRRCGVAAACRLAGRLPHGAQLEIHRPVGSPAEANSCARLSLCAGGGLSGREQAALRVYASLLKEPAFRELRTKQQVGYSVSASHDVSLVHVDGGEAPLRVEGLVVCATSKSLGAAEVLVRIDQFLAAFRAGALASLDEATVRRPLRLTAYPRRLLHCHAPVPRATAPIVITGLGRRARRTATQVRDHAEALATRLPAPPKRLAAESDEWWAQIRDRRLDFGVRARLAIALRRVTPAGVRAMFDRMVACRLSSLVYGTAHPLQPQAAEAGSGLPPPVLPPRRRQCRLLRLTRRPWRRMLFVRRCRQRRLVWIRRVLCRWVLLVRRFRTALRLCRCWRHVPLHRNPA